MALNISFTALQLGISRWTWSEAEKITIYEQNYSSILNVMYKYPIMLMLLCSFHVGHIRKISIWLGFKNSQTFHNVLKNVLTKETLWKSELKLLNFNPFLLHHAHKSRINIKCEISFQHQWRDPMMMIWNERKNNKVNFRRSIRANEETFAKNHVDVNFCFIALLNSLNHS